MFGWEFPPHISGGLGTACNGLTRGLTELNGIRIIFVVPRIYGDEEQSEIQLIGANQIPVTRKWVESGNETPGMDIVRVESEIIPYLSPEQFWAQKNKRSEIGSRFIQVNEEGKIDFSGTYGNDLYREIRNYAIVAELIARENAFDLIHAHDWLTYPAGIAAKAHSGKPLVIHVHATEFDRSGGNINPLVYSIEREGMEAADKIIAVSNLTRNTVIEKYGISPDKVVTVYNAAEPVSDEEKIRTRNGLKRKVVTYLGRITLQKGPSYFVEAASLVLNKTENVHFVMAGSGDMTETVVEQAARLGITNNFHFTGFLNNEDVKRMFGMSDVFVMPSVSEPFGIVPLEAMHSGVPVIISRQSGVAEILKNAIKVDFWDTFAMADAIYGLLNYPVLSDLFKSLGKKEAENIQWKNSADEVCQVYRTLICESTK